MRKTIAIEPNVTRIFPQVSNLMEQPRMAYFVRKNETFPAGLDIEQCSKNGQANVDPKQTP